MSDLRNLIAFYEVVIEARAARGADADEAVLWDYRFLQSLAERHIPAQDRAPTDPQRRLRLWQFVEWLTQHGYLRTNPLDAEGQPS